MACCVGSRLVRARPRLAFRGRAPLHALRLWGLLGRGLLLREQLFQFSQVDHALLQVLRARVVLDRLVVERDQVLLRLAALISSHRPLGFAVADRPQEVVDVHLRKLRLRHFFFGYAPLALPAEVLHEPLRLDVFYDPFHTLLRLRLHHQCQHVRLFSFVGLTHLDRDLFWLLLPVLDFFDGVVVRECLQAPNVSDECVLLEQEDVVGRHDEIAFLLGKFDYFFAVAPLVLNRHSLRHLLHAGVQVAVLHVPPDVQVVLGPHVVAPVLRHFDWLLRKHCFYEAGDFFDYLEK